VIEGAAAAEAMAMAASIIIQATVRYSRRKACRINSRRPPLTTAASVMCPAMG